MAYEVFNQFDIDGILIVHRNYLFNRILGFYQMEKISNKKNVSDTLAMLLNQTQFFSLLYFFLLFSVA